ncbi:DUF4251 domain-containing protein [Flavobacterium sp.]|uniref:DUF4251 domain-containing protein n=1 Tax=Flavobacterium sp. TaxID=239 RepID=UPI003263AB72
METELAIFLTLISFLSFDGTAQEKTKKEIKNDRKFQEKKQTEALIASKNFVFDAERVITQRGRLLVLDYNTYFVKFNIEKAEGDLPFFGRAFNIAYGSDGGIKFEGKPENVKIEKKKKSHIVKMTVRGKEDTYDLIFSVFYDGGTTLSINSNKRAPISYDGNIRAPKTQSDNNSNTQN